MLSPTDYVSYFIVVVVMGALYAVIYMIAQALENQKLLAVAKAEMQEVLIGGFMVILLSYIVFNAAQGIGYYAIKSFVPTLDVKYTGSSAPTTSDDLFFFSKAGYLQQDITAGYSSVFISASTLAGNAAAASSSYLSRGIEGSQEIGSDLNKGGASGSFTTYLCRPVAIIATLINEIASVVSRTITIMFAQNMLVDAARFLYIPFFMLGIILRSFNVVRGIGAFFIGFSIALFVYPIFLILMEGYTIEHFSNSMGLDILSSSGISALNGKINDLGYYTPYWGSGVNYCDEAPKKNLVNDMDAYRTSLDSGVTMDSGNNIATIGSLMFAMLLAQGFALTMVVSLTGGIAKVMGADISPFIIGNITRIGAM
jgi:hypothetical protein